MILKLILLLSIVLVAAEGCPHESFKKKHICENCDFDDALAKAEATNAARKGKPTNKETVFAIPSGSKWTEETSGDQQVCRLNEAVTCYDFRKTGKGEFTDYKQGTGRAVHDAGQKNGHYEKDLAGACNAKNQKTWTKIEKK